MVIRSSVVFAMITPIAPPCSALYAFTEKPYVPLSIKAIFPETLLGTVPPKGSLAYTTSPDTFHSSSPGCGPKFAKEPFILPAIPEGEVISSGRRFNNAASPVIFTIGDWKSPPL